MSREMKPLLEIKNEARKALLQAISKEQNILGKISQENLRSLIHLKLITSIKTPKGMRYVITGAGIRLLEEYQAFKV